MKKRPYSRWHKNTRHRILKWFAPRPFCSLLTADKTKKSVNDSKRHDKSLASGENVSLRNAWPVSKIVQGAGDRVIFPPKVIMEVKALACQLPCERNLPFSRLSSVDIAREAINSGIVASISGTTCLALAECRCDKALAIPQLDLSSQSRLCPKSQPCIRFIPRHLEGQTA